MSARFIALLALVLTACTGEVSPLGVGEPIRVHDATLRSDDLPGGVDAEGLRVTAIESTGGVWARGQLERSLSGRVSAETFAVGLRLVDLGSGWWTMPAGAPDPAFAGERIWNVTLDVGGGLPPGVHTLRLVALDEAGVGGAWSDLSVCVVDPRVPDNLNACDPSIAPPDAVIVLSWDEDADLDLIVVTPEGKTVDARHPTTALLPESGVLPPELARDRSVGRLDGDSLAECRPDGRSSESLTWQEPTTVPGLYHVYANLYDACAHPSARFTVTTYRREQVEGGQFRLAQSEQRTGVLLAASANGGAGQPLYVTSVSLP